MATAGPPRRRRRLRSLRLRLAPDGKVPYRIDDAVVIGMRTFSGPCPLLIQPDERFDTMKSAFISALTMTVASSVMAQYIPIPNRLDGFRPSSHANRSASLVLEAHYDFMCPDSRAASEVLDTVLPQFKASDL